MALMVSVVLMTSPPTTTFLTWMTSLTSIAITMTKKRISTDEASSSMQGQVTSYAHGDLFQLSPLGAHPKSPVHGPGDELVSITGYTYCIIIFQLSRTVNTYLNLAARLIQVTIRAGDTVLMARRITRTILSRNRHLQTSDAMCAPKVVSISYPTLLSSPSSLEDSIGMRLGSLSNDIFATIRV